MHISNCNQKLDWLGARHFCLNPLSPQNIVKWSQHANDLTKKKKDNVHVVLLLYYEEEIVIESLEPYTCISSE